MISKEYLKKEIFRQTKIEGDPGYEGKILDYLEEKLKNCTNIENLTRDDKFGICCVLPPKKEVKRTVLLEAHADIVRKVLIEPSMKILQEVEIIEATALDNRVNCSIIISLLEKVQFENTRIIALFCIGEENGKIGSKWFCKNENCNRILKDISVDEVYVLDVCCGALPDGYYDPIFTVYSGRKYDILKDFLSDDESNIAMIGKGFCPVQQQLGMKEETFSNYTDLHSFIKSSKSYRSKFRDSKFGFFSVPVVDMHHKNSFCSIDDAFGLLDHLQNFLAK